MIFGTCVLVVGNMHTDIDAGHFKYYFISFVS